MPTTRISQEDRQVLQALSARTGKQHSEILHEALDQYQRDQLLDEINRGFERLRASAKDWQAELAERELWEATLGDGQSD